MNIIYNPLKFQNPSSRTEKNKNKNKFMCKALFFYKMHTLCTTTMITIFIFSLIPISTTDALTKQRQYLSLQDREFLSPQNAARTALRMKPLVWDKGLARYAQRYANQRRKDCALRHSNGPYGENIFWGSGNGWTPAEAVMEWVSERKFYSYWSNSCSGGQQCGHYTQIVWSSTWRVGCARVICTGGKGVFMTCNYDPPGNYVGQRPY